MKVLTISLITLILIGCTEKEPENGLNLKQLQSSVNQKERVYFEDLKNIFQNYDLVLYDHQLIRTTNFFYLVERDGFFNMDQYREIVMPRFKENGWILIKKNDYGELYCNREGQAIGVTFPAENKDLEGVNIGFYTYQFYKKISITLNYDLNGKSNNCTRVLS